MEQKLLSICLLTYNRAEYLAVCLDSIVDQLHTNPLLADEIEVVISDDGSTDNTADVVKRFMAEHKNIKYFKNEKNLGFDGNVLAAINHSSGKYCWLFSDDDAFVPGSFDLVIERIKKEPEIGYVYVNTEAYAQDFKSSLGSFGVNNFEIARVSSAEEFLLHYNIPGFLSSQIFERKLWQSVNCKPYLGNMWVQTSVILEFLPKAKILYIGKPLVLARDDSRWTRGGKNMATFLNLKHIISGLVQFGYSPKAIKKMERAFANDLVGVTIDAKRKGLGFSLGCIGKTVQEFYQFPIKMVAGLAWLLAPQALVKLAKKIKARRV